MEVISHQAGLCSNLSKVLAHLSNFPDTPYLKWNMRPASYGFEYDVAEVFSHLFRDYGTPQEITVTTTNPHYPAALPEGGQCITGREQHSLYLRSDNWRQALSGVYRKFFTTQPAVRERVAEYQPRLMAYPHRVAIMSRGSPLGGEQASGHMPGRETYRQVISDYQQRHPVDQLVFFLRVDNSEDLEYYRATCHPYPVVFTDIDRQATSNIDPHVNVSLSVRQAVAVIAELELCALCEALVHPVSNMATIALVMNPTMKSHYLR
jgi:hypothetical protein